MKELRRIALEIAKELRAQAERLETMLAREENADVVAAELVTFLQRFVTNYPLGAIMRAWYRGH